MTSKLLLKIYLGAVLAKLHPKKTALIRQEFTLPSYNSGLSDGLTERLIRCHMGHKALRSVDGKGLEELHRDFWKNQSAWYERTYQRFMQRHFPLLKTHINTLEKLINEHQTQTICEIGTGNGYWIAYMQKQLHNAERFVGIDLSSSQIVVNRDRYPDVEFVDGDANAWIHEHGVRNTLYVVNGGVFEYFHRTSLQALFATIASSGSGNLLAIFNEPLGEHHDLENDIESYPNDVEYSTSHNYPHLILQAGFTILSQHISDEVGYRALTLLARPRTELMSESSAQNKSESISVTCAGKLMIA